MDERNVRQKISAIIMKDIKSVRKIDDILFLAGKLESDRNDIVYGAPLENDHKLREKLDSFIELKRIIEKESDVHE